MIPVPSFLQSLQTQKPIWKRPWYSRFAVDQGYLPITPHLLFPQFMDDSNEAERNLAMRMNIILLTKCAELWAFGDRISKGMSIEIARARRKGQTVRFFTDDCKEVN